MIRRALLSALLLVAVPAAAADFAAAFTGRTLRLDYYHSGTAGEEHISADEVRLEGEWPGSRTRLLDDTNLGRYLFEVRDAATNLPVYSRGFASIYGEWETTGEAAAGVWRTFHEGQRFPEPRGRCQVVISKRADDGSFRQIFSTLVDPAAREIDRSPIAPRGTVWTVFENGPPAVKVDLLVLGDGYSAAEADKFKADVERLTSALFSTEPFKSHRGDFNVRALTLASPDSGITDPRAPGGGAWHASPLGFAYNAFDSERYVLSFADRTVHEVAAQAPYDALLVLANGRKYGGGGIFNLWTVAAAGSGEAPYLVTHEFGHSFAGLADEYYTSQVSYTAFTPPGSEPWEPNVTALLDPTKLKWKDLVAPGTPLPTPWDQARFDEVSLAYQKKREALRAAGAPEEQMEALFAEVKAATEPLLDGEKHAGEVGAFEGAGYEAKGLYRPAIDCIMFTRNHHRFCPVCARAIERVIRLYAE